jgi:hypothetical protein
MAILFFVGIATLGRASTSMILYKITHKRKISDHQHALILAIGFGATWLLSILAPFVVSGNDYHLNSDIILFGIALSVGVAIITYLIDQAIIKLGR